MKEPFFLRPLFGKLIVRPIEEPDIQGGIIVLDRAKDLPTRGEVIRVANGRVNKKGQVVPMDFEVGEIVLFHKYEGKAFRHEGELYLVMDGEKVVGKEV